jgi:hypothetical protein
MALYNTSINNDGLRFLQQQKDLLSALAREVKKDTVCCELKLMALRLLQSLTCQIPSATVLKDMMKHVRTRTTLTRQVLALTAYSYEHNILKDIFKLNSLSYT